MNLERSLVRRISRLSRQWSLIEPDDRVMVACSGGKDSWALLHLLRAYREVVPFSFDIVAMNLDQGHPGFDAKVLAEHFERHGFEYRIEFADTYSVVKANTPPGKTYCSRCSRMRRGILHRVAGELGATKIALGHHRDDAIETALLSMMYAGQIRSMPPRLDPEPGEHGVLGCGVIRPLASCAEEDLAAYASAIGVPIVPCNLCGTQPDARRAGVRALLKTLEKDNPEVRRSLFAALRHVRVNSLYDLELRGAQPPGQRALPIIGVHGGKLDSANI